MSMRGLAVRFGGRRDHVIDDIHCALDALEAGRSHQVQWYSATPQQPAPVPTTTSDLDSDSESSDDCAWTTAHLDSCLGPGTQDMTVRFCEMDIVLSQSLGESQLAPLFDESWIASQVWAGALVLCEYLAWMHRDGQTFTGKSVIELGAGCGLCGLSAAKLGADAVITDVGDVIDLISYNVQANDAGGWSGAAQPRSEQLMWGSADAEHFVVDGGVDLILMADCIYQTIHSEEQIDQSKADPRVEALVHTVAQLSGPNTTVVVANSRRGEGTANDQFFELASAYGFVSSNVDCTELQLVERAVENAAGRVSIDASLIKIWTLKLEKLTE